MFEVVSIGSALVDIFIASDNFLFNKQDDSTLLCQKYGEKLAVDSFEVWPGGGGNNTATGFSRLGFDSAVVAETGKDPFSQVIMKALQAEGVATELIIAEKKEKTGGSVIMVGKNGGRTVLTYRGAASQLDPIDIKYPSLQGLRWVHLSSIGGHAEVLQQVFAHCHTNHIGMSWNPGKAELELLADGRLSISELPVKILMINAEEWAMVANQQGVLQHTIPEIIVTDGDKGGALYQGSESFPYTALSVNSVDDTGAGDAFVVGYVAARLLDKDTQQALRWGAANAAAVVGAMGATPGLLRKDQLDSVS